MPDPVQPAEGGTPEQTGPAPDAGQGGEGTGGLYDLSSVPEDVRQYVEPHLKAIEGNVTKRFQEYAQARETWAPYEELGINEVDPQQLQQLLQFAELAQDEEAFADWWWSVGERLELFEDAGGSEDEDDPDLFDDELTPEGVQELIAEALQPVVEQLTETDQRTAEAEAQAEIQDQLDAIVEEHGPETDTDAILRLAYPYAEEDPDNAVARGLEDYLRLIGKGEAGLFEQKTRDNGIPPEGAGGGADTRPQKVLTFDDAKAAGLARLKAAHNA